jgi:hypothetical protein
MADQSAPAGPDPRHQLLQSLLQNLQNFQLPHRYTEEEKAQIMKGRRTQADIDAGRKSIADNEQIYQQGVAQQGQLQQRIGQLQNDIGTATETSRRQAHEDWINSPGGQTYEVSKWAVPIAGGTYLGHRSAAGIEQRFKEMAPAAQAASSRFGRFSPYLSKSMTYFLPEGAALREWVAPRMQEGTPRDLVNAAGTGLIAAGATTVGEGAVRALTPKAVPGINDQVPPPPAPPSAPPQAAAALPAPDQQKMPNAERLRNAVSATGAPIAAKAGKTAHYNIMKKNLNAANLPDVADALGLARNADRASVLSHARSIMKLPGRSAIFLPLAAAGAAYEMAGSDRAEAATGAPAREPGIGERAAAAATAGGTAYGAQKLMAKIPAGAGELVGGMGGPLTAMSFDPLEGESREATARNIEEARQSVAQLWPWGGQHLLGISPQEQEIHRMAQMPERSPANSGPRQSRLPGADQDVARAWRQSPRSTAIQLSRDSGLDPEDIAHLAGTTADEVHSVLRGIPQQALAGR